MDAKRLLWITQTSRALNLLLQYTPQADKNALKAGRLILVTTLPELLSRLRDQYGQVGMDLNQIQKSIDDVNFDGTSVSIFREFSANLLELIDKANLQSPGFFNEDRRVMLLKGKLIHLTIWFNYVSQYFVACLVPPGIVHTYNGMVAYLITLAEQEGTGLDDLAAVQSAQAAFASANVAMVLGAKGSGGKKKQHNKKAGAKRGNQKTPPNRDELKALYLQLDTDKICAKYYCDNENHCMGDTCLRKEWHQPWKELTAQQQDWVITFQKIKGYKPRFE
jgi:hypothetical protein